MTRFIPRLVILIGLATCQMASAHEIFQEVLKEHYGLRSFACKTCHPDGDDRTQLTVYAALIADELKEGGNWSEKFHLAEEEGEEAVEAFEKLIASEFKKRVERFGERTLTVDQLMESGLLTGVRLDPQKQRETKLKGGVSNEFEPSVPLFYATLLGGLWMVSRRVRFS